MPRVFSAFKMAARRRRWQTASTIHKLANHKARCHFETIKFSNISGDVLNVEKILGTRLKFGGGFAHVKKETTAVSNKILNKCAFCF